MKVWAYGWFGAPLAMAALPIYVLAPDYFGRGLGLPLAAVGVVLFATRLLDAGLDPWLGDQAERLRAAGRHRSALLTAIPLLGVSFAALWQPPPLGMTGQLAWFAFFLLATCLLHSAINLAYLAWGARLHDLPVLCLKASATREGFGIVGVLLASVLPAWLSLRYGPAPGMAGFSLIFLLFLAIGAYLLLKVSPPWRQQNRTGPSSWRALLGESVLRPLLLPYFLNALAVALPSALALFFIGDQLQASAEAGWLLGLYFLGAIAGLPVWQHLGRTLGLLRAWAVGMLLAITCFAGAAALGAGDLGAYAAICLLSGLALGADLCLPPLLIAQRLPAHRPLAAAYGIFQTLGKLALAFAGLALAGLAQLGYQPGLGGHWALVAAYALLPCLLKAAAWLLLRSRSVRAVYEGAAPRMNERPISPSE